jgi:hypothetical protein
MALPVDEAASHVGLALLALLVGAGVALAWRAHALAHNTHDILNQILENQAGEPDKGTGGQRAEAAMIITLGSEPRWPRARTSGLWTSV